MSTPREEGDERAPRVGIGLTEGPVGLLGRPKCPAGADQVAAPLLLGSTGVARPGGRREGSLGPLLSILQQLGRSDTLSKASKYQNAMDTEYTVSSTKLTFLELIFQL